MSKKDKEISSKLFAGIGDADPVRLITNHVNKKGKLKGDKREKKMLRNVCPHHMITRKGKLKATTESDGKGNVRCWVCGDIIPMKLASDAEVAKASNNLYKYVSQTKMMAQAIGAGKKATAQATDTATAVRMFPKLYVNLRNVVQKQNNAKKKKNKKKSYNSSSSYGAWGTRRF